jgi:hypothetical protein
MDIHSRYAVEEMARSQLSDLRQMKTAAKNKRLGSKEKHA